MFRRKKVKEKRPSPFLCPAPRTTFPTFSRLFVGLGCPKGGFRRVIIFECNYNYEEFVVFFVNAFR